jgi:hypothetical protein
VLLDGIAQRLATRSGDARKGAADPQSLPFEVSDPMLDHARVIPEARFHHVLGI